MQNLCSNKITQPISARQDDFSIFLSVDESALGVSCRLDMSGVSGLRGWSYQHDLGHMSVSAGETAE